MLIAISEQDSRPIYIQIAAEIKRQIQDGVLQPGDELPPVRELAASLGINLHTVHHAYRILREQGVIYLRLGQRARIAPLRQVPAGREQIDSTVVPKLDDLITEAFHLGLSPEDLRRLLDERLGSRGRGDRT